jgi:hypothetical protein
MPNYSAQFYASVPAMAKLTANQKKALWAVAITTFGGVVIAAINILPSLIKPQRTTSAPLTTPTLTKSLSSTGNNSTVINAEESTVTVGSSPDPRVGDLIEAGLPAVKTIYVILSSPIENQVLLYPEDEVSIFAPNASISEVNFGSGWQPFEERRPYLVQGIEGQPVVPQFRGSGGLKLRIVYTKNRNRQRDFHDPSRPVIKN